ncbi:MAG: O-antigen ligase family protein, partial [Anaerolineae bacterium]|nr:O-antigen ligase family protein [Anaerolineae bacterium]
MRLKTEDYIQSSRLPFLPRLPLFLVCILLGVAAGAAVAWVNPIIVIAGVLGLVVGVALLQHLQWSVWALIGVLTLLPFGAVRLGIGFNPTFLNLTFLAMLAAWAMLLVGRQIEGWRGSALWLPTLLYAGVAVFGFVLGTANATPSRDLVRRFAEFLLALSLVWLLPNILRHRQQVLQATRVLILGGGLAAMLGVGLYVIPDALAVRLLSALRVFDYPAGPGVLRYINDDPSLAQRATGTSIDPNAFGGLLIVVTALTIPHLFARRPLIPHRLAWLLVAVMGLAVFATRSRGSMLGLLAAAGFIALLRYRRLLVWMLVAVALILVLPWTQDYVASFFAGVRGQDLSTQMRFGEYKDALILISRHPWLGVGYGATPDIDLYIGVSSLYLLMAENIGLIGLAVFLLVMGRFFLVARQGWGGADAVLEPVVLGGAAALAGILVAGVFDHYFANIKFPASVTLFWLVIALTTVAAQMAATPPPSPPLAR